jgi:hypothetical protein
VHLQELLKGPVTFSNSSTSFSRESCLYAEVVSCRPAAKRGSDTGATVQLHTFDDTGRPCRSNSRNVVEKQKRPGKDMIGWTSIEKMLQRVSRWIQRLSRIKKGESPHHRTACTARNFSETK